jgi:hypothetical protein
LLGSWLAGKLTRQQLPVCIENDGMEAAYVRFAGLDVEAM